MNIDDQFKLSGQLLRISVPFVMDSLANIIKLRRRYVILAIPKWFLEHYLPYLKHGVKYVIEKGVK